MLKKIKFSYEVSDNQDNLFSCAHTRFNVCIETERGEFITEYQCNTRYYEPNKRDVLECLLSDISCIEESADVEDFLFNFGYTDSPEAIRNGFKVYEECKKEHEAIHRIFSEAELEELYVEIFED